jgi:co-chaperonin GroES (HSP10)
MEFNFEAPDGFVFINYRHPEKVEKDGSGLYKINERKNKSEEAVVHSVGRDVSSIDTGDTILFETAMASPVSDGIFSIREEDVLLVLTPASV